MYQQWSDECSEVDQISLLIAKADAMQKALDKMSVKAVAHHRPQSCSWCGDPGHVYAYCPFVQGDEESDQLYYFSNFEPQSAPPEPFITQAEIDFMREQSKINQMMFEQIQALSANLADLATPQPLEPQPAPPEQFITRAEIDFMHEQSKINQMMFEQMQAISAQLAGLAAQNKMMETQLGNQASSSQQNPEKLPSQPELNPRGEANAITLRSGTQYKAPDIPADSAAPHTDRAYSTRPVHTPDSVRAGPARPPVSAENQEHTVRTDSTRTVHTPMSDHTARTDSARPAGVTEIPEHTDRVDSTRPVPEETVAHTDRVEYTRSAQKEEKGKEKACAVQALTDSLKELTHGPHASHADRARKLEGMGNEESHGSHKSHTGEAAHGPDTYHTDRALAAWSLFSVPRYFRPPRCAEIHPTHHPPPLHHSLHVW